jgi:predicted MFS family arabinose efflux permease
MDTPERPDIHESEPVRMPLPRSSHWFDEYMDNVRRISPESWWFLLGTMFVSLAWLTFMLLFNLYMKERGYPEGVMGQVLSAQSFGTMAMAVPAAYLVSRLSARAALAWSSIGVAIGFTWITLVDVKGLIIAAAFMAGMMMAFSRVYSSPFLMKYTSSSERAIVFSLNFAASLGSGLVAHLGAGTLHAYFTVLSGSSVEAYRWVLWCSAGCGVLGAFAYSRLPSGAISEPRARTPVREFLRAKGPLFFRLVFPSFLVGLGAGLIIPFLNLYFRDRFDLSTQTIGVYYAMVQASMIVGVLFGPELARRYGMVRTIVISELASLPFMAILAFTHDLTLATVAFLARGAFMNLGVPIANNYLMERVGPEDRATANSMSLLAWASSWAITAAIGGWMIEQWGYAPPLLAGCGLYVASSLLYYSYFRNEDIHAGRMSPGMVDPE